MEKKKRVGKIRIPLKIKEILSDNKIEFELHKLQKEDLLKEFESKMANKDGCYCNPGGGGC